MSKLVLSFLIILVWLQYSFWFGKNGLYDYNRINDDIKIKKMVNDKLKARNNRLFSKINNCNNTQRVTDTHICNELSIIKFPGSLSSNSL